MNRALLILLVVGSTTLALSQDFVQKGKAALAAKDTAAAVQAFEAAVKAGQKSGDANYYLGTIHAAHHQYDAAVHALESSVKVNDDNADAFRLLGDMYRATKNPSAALTAYLRAEKLSKKNPTINAAIGLTYLALDSVEAAIRSLTLAKDTDPTNAAIYMGLGDAYLKQRVVPLAITNYQKAIELEPKNAAFRYKLADVYTEDRKYTEAVHEYDGVIENDPSNPDAYLAKGRILVRAKLFSRAIPALKKFVELQPKHVEGSALLAKAYQGADIYEEAAKAAKTSLQLDSSNVDVWRVYGQASVKTRDFATAIASYQALKRRNAFKSEDQSDYGAALFGIGREDDAMNALLTAVAEDSTNCDPYFNLGFLYMKKKDYEKAASMFEKKIACDPKSLSAYLNGAACYYQLKNFARVRELVTRSLELKSDFLQARLWLARYYIEVDSLEMAKGQYDKILEEGAKNPEKFKKEMQEAHQQSAQYYFMRKQYDRTIESYRKAQAAGADNASLHLGWGQALLQTLDPKNDAAENAKRKEEAVRHFRRSVELEPGNAQAHLWLGQGLIMSRVEGDDALNQKLKLEACGEFVKVLRLDPRNEDAKKSQDRIGCK